MQNYSTNEKEVWKKRIAFAIACNDNVDIPRHKDAGKIIEGKCVMHNGLFIDPSSYYGNGILQMLIENKGVHEPQEEKVFQLVLNKIKPNSIMLELGSYWSFYSMWFYQKVSNAQCYMVEGNYVNYKFGKRNFKLNKYNGNFLFSYISNRNFITRNGVKYSTVDYILATYNIPHLSILHADIQGFEYNMLKGAEETLKNKKVDYLFISTHTNQLHEKCKEHLLQLNYFLLADVNLDESFSSDGFLVFVAHKNLLFNINLHKR